MRLLRLKSKSNDNTGHFQNTFRTPIRIDPYSEIALVNAVIALDARLIVVSSSNNKMSFTRKDSGSTSNVVVPPETYSTRTFIKALDTAMNSSMAYEPLLSTKPSFLWIPAVQSNGICQLGYSRENDVQDASFPVANGTMMEIDPALPQQVKPKVEGAPTDAFPAFIRSNNTFNPGVGQVGCLVSGNDKVIVGLLKNLPESTTTDFDHTLYRYGIVYDGALAGATYKSIVDGVMSDTGVNCNDDDVIQILLNKGKIEYQLDNGTPIGITSYDFDSPPLNIACSMSGNNMIATQFQYHPNLAHTSLAGPLNPIHVKTFETGMVSSGVGAGAGTKITITMPEAIQELLGYDSNPTVSTLQEGAFYADIPLQDTSSPLSLSIELPNLGRMENHDGYDGERKNLVALIPKLTQSGTDLVYEASFPLYININNQYPINLSSLECRILSSRDNSEIELEEPGCSLLFALHKPSTGSPQDSTK